MQTLRTGCSKVEPNNFAPSKAPSQGRTRTQFGEDWCTQFRVIMVTDPQTNTHPQTGPITIHCAAKLSMQCSNKPIPVIVVVVVIIIDGDWLISVLYLATLFSWALLQVWTGPRNDSEGVPCGLLKQFFTGQMPLSSPNQQTVSKHWRDVMIDI